MKDNKAEYCSCGFPQSYPIPHEHDLSEREKRIKEACRKQGALKAYKEIVERDKLIYDALDSSDKYLIDEIIEVNHGKLIKYIEKRIKELEEEGVEQK